MFATHFWSTLPALACVGMMTFFCPLLAAQQNSISSSPSENQLASFEVPDGWRYAEASMLPQHVHIMVVGKGSQAYPPSINLATEEYAGSLASYLEIVKKINSQSNSSWKSLGMVKTKAGEANLSQVETRTEWGEVKMMHAILSKGGIIYIVTASALKSEFPTYYRQFFNSIRSLEVMTKEP